MTIKKRTKNYVIKALKEIDDLRDRVIDNFKDDPYSAECRWYLAQLKTVKLCLENMLIDEGK